MTTIAFFVGLLIFGAGWLIVGVIYWGIILPELKRRYGNRVFLEAGLQLNLTKHLRKYEEIAREEGSVRGIQVVRAVKCLIISSVVAFLMAMLVTMF